jgi:hypothetical protein
MLKILFAIVGSIGLVAFLMGVVALIRPYGNISTRKRGFGVMACGMVAFVLTGVFGPPPEKQGKESSSKNSSETASTDFGFIAKANAKAKLIALRGPSWSKQDLTYAISACWKLSSGVNISYGRGTCALVMEELSIPTYGIGGKVEPPIGACYSAAMYGLFRTEEIDKAIQGGMPAMDAILKHNAESSDLTSMKEEFANCQKALPGVSKEVKLVHVPDYATQAAKLMPGRRKREGFEALESAYSIEWPDERVEEKAKFDAQISNLDAKRKAEAEQAIEELK